MSSLPITHYTREKNKPIYRYYSTKINTLRGGKKHINSYKSIYRIIYNKVSELLKLHGFKHGFKPEQSYNKKKLRQIGNFTLNYL